MMTSMETMGRGMFLDAIDACVFGVDGDGACLFINRMAVSALGYPDAESLIGRDMHDLVHHKRGDGSAHPRDESPLLRAERTGKASTHGRETLWKRDGTALVADYSAFPMPEWAAGSGAVAVFTPATHALPSADASGEDGHGDIALLSPDSVVTIDQHSRILAFNEVAERAFGGTAAQVFKKDFAEVAFPEAARAAVRERIAAFLAEGSESSAVVWEVEARRFDGTTFPTELSLFTKNMGSKRFYAVHLRDITAKRQDRAQIREGEARFRTLANGISQLSWMTDASGSIVWYNQRWYDYTGTRFEDMAGWGWRSIHHPDHLERVERRFRAQVAVGEPWEDTFPLRGADGSFRWFLSRALPIRDDANEADSGGPIIGWFGTNTDITDIRDAEQRLEAARDEAETANRAKSTFIANMSHELRTPLSAIIGYAEMLSEEIEEGVEPTDLGRDVQKIEGNARHLLGLINDVLDLSKVESGKMDAYIETFDLATMAGDVASTIHALMEKKNNAFDLVLGDDLGTMRSDVTRVRQILLNLLGNAAKFTEAGRITLAISREAHADGDRVRFEVSDTGIGMNQEQIAKLFQRFQQADASTTRQFGGTGLGLALTKAFASLLGGEVGVTSSEGEGSVFTVVLPVSIGEASTDDVIDAEDRVEVEAGRDIVLVVDDDETQRELMSRFLVREGYAARTAADGPTGIELARRLKPRAILLDVTMPGMDGWSVLSALKADADLAAIPVVMVTFVSERALASSLGAADYVVKPVDWSRLRHVMEAFRDAEGDVLVVDDEEDSRQRSRQALEKNGWSVVEAANGQEGLDQVSRSIPRVILLDLNMPVMDGFDFLKALRARPGCADIPVVVLTALDLTAEDRRRLRGANQVLNKGSTPMRDLVDKLRRLGSTRDEPTRIAEA